MPRRSSLPAGGRDPGHYLRHVRGASWSFLLGAVLALVAAQGLGSKAAASSLTPIAGHVHSGGYLSRGTIFLRHRLTRCGCLPQVRAWIDLHRRTVPLPTCRRGCGEEEQEEQQEEKQEEKQEEGEEGRRGCWCSTLTTAFTMRQPQA